MKALIPVHWDDWRGAYVLTEAEIEAMVQKAIRYIQENKAEKFVEYMAGDTRVVARRIGAGKVESIQVELDRPLKVGHVIRGP